MLNVFKRLLAASLIVAACNAQAVYSYDLSELYVNYKKVITDLFKEVDDAKISDEERSGISNKGGGSPVYGEILFESVSVLLDYLQLCEDDVFFDLGSGLGKLTYQVYLMSPVQKAIGVELSETRVKKAQSIEKNGAKIYAETFKFENAMREKFGIEKLEKINGKMFKYYHESFLDADLSKATVVFTCSTCFNDECMTSLTNILSKLNEGLRILTLKQLAPHNDLVLVKTFYLGMTWASNVPVYVYVLDREGKYPRESVEGMTFANEESVPANEAAAIPANQAAAVSVNQSADEAVPGGTGAVIIKKAPANQVATESQEVLPAAPGGPR